MRFLVSVFSFVRFSFVFVRSGACECAGSADRTQQMMMEVRVRIGEMVLDVGKDDNTLNKGFVIRGEDNVKDEVSARNKLCKFKCF